MKQALTADLFERAAPLIRILGHPHRLQLCVLLLSESLSVNELADRLGDHPNAVSQHLKMMKAMGMLTSRHIGKKVFYEIVDDRIPCLLQCLATPSRHPEDRAERPRF